MLNDITTFYRCEFFKFIDSLISTFEEKSQSLTNVFQPFLKVIDPDTPGNLKDARKLVAANIALSLASKHSLFKIVSRVYQLFLTAATSVCTNERSFSALKRIKNHLRSTMGRARLNGCMLIAAERNLTYDISKEVGSGPF